MSRRRPPLRRIAGATGISARAAPGTLALYVTLTLAAGAVPVAVAWLTKLLLDNLVRGVTPGTLIGFAALLGVTGAAASVAPQLIRYLRSQLERQTAAYAQDRLFRVVEGFTGLGRFENPAFLDRLRLARQAARTTVSQVVEDLLGIGAAAITITGFLGSLLVLNPVLTLIVLASGVPAVLAELALARHRAGMFWKIGPIERREIFYGELLTSVESAKEVRLFGIGEFFRRRMQIELRTANAGKRTMDRRELRVQAGLGLLAAMVSGFGLLWTVAAAGGGALSVGGIAMFIAAVAGVQGSLAALAGTAANARESLLIFDHYLAVTTAGPDLPVTTRPRALPALRHGIELDDVWFRYSEDHSWVLRGISLFIPYGRALALVGLNGAGKSTLVKLLCRFYDPTRGSIRWDGVDLREMDPAEIRRRISAVFQDHMHYDLTAAENIGLGEVTLMGDRSRIEKAAADAGIHRTLVELPSGYDTMLSRIFFLESEKDDPQAGVELSGGQWQRLALARALLREQRDLIILDEPSAGLDAEAEHEIHTFLTRHRGGRTSLLISHRLGAVRDADIIVVLRDGRIVEHGNHVALMAAGGRYARLFALQAAGYHPEPALVERG